MTVNPVAFFVLSACILGGALAVVTVRNLTHAVGALAITLFLVGVLYLAVGADLLGAVQITLGAVGLSGVLVICVLLTSGQAAPPSGVGPGRVWLWGVVISAAVTALLVAVLGAGHGDWYTADYPQRLLDQGTIEALGRSLLQQHPLALVVAILTVAVGVAAAAVLARPDRAEAAFDARERLRRQRDERIRQRRAQRSRDVRSGRAPAVTEDAPQ